MFAHLPLILNPDGTKMSKRKSQTAVADYIAQGFTREALVNYFAFLGWSPTEEDVLTLDEITDRFELDKVQKGGARFDRERLEWLNGQWIRRLDDDDLVDRLLPFLEAARLAGQVDRVPNADERLLPIVRERIRPWRRSSRWRVPVARRPRARPCGARAQALGRGDDARRPLPRATSWRARRGDLGGRRARAAAADARRGARLEGRRPVHGDPRRHHRADGDAAAVRHARRASAATGRSPGSMRRSRGSEPPDAPLLES